MLDIEQRLGRKLTDKEQSVLNWLKGWDRETVETFDQLFHDMFKAGQAMGRGEKYD